MARTEERTRGGPEGWRAPRPQANGQEPGDHPGPGPGARFGLRGLILPVLALAVVPVAFFGFLHLQSLGAYVETDRAQVTGRLVVVGPSASVQVRSVLVEAGDSVERNQVVATVVSGGGQVLALRSSIDGFVLARYANPGDAVQAGRPILTLLDPSDMWVQAQLEESQLARVKAGQPVTISVEALGHEVTGRVVSIGSASMSALAAAAGQAPSATRSPQLVPVKIALDQPHPGLVYGGQAFVRIAVR